MKIIWLLLCLCLTGSAWAHQTSSSYLYLNTQTAEGRLDVAVSDLQRVVDFDSNRDASVSWREILDQQPVLENYVHQRLQLGSRQVPCTIRWQPPALTQHTDGPYLAFVFNAGCPADTKWEIHYSVLFDRDTLHRALLQWESASGAGLSVLRAEQARFVVPMISDQLQVFADYCYQGITHLLIGYDHILFLLALLLPIANLLIRSAISLKPALLDTLSIVSLFTLAHSCTLALSALDVMRLPASMVEIAIALSVSGAGIVALVPAWHRYRYGLSFGFGLVHGFGFANVLSELVSSTTDRIVPLTAFNLGVEIGQVIVISILLPAIYFGRRWLNRVSWTLSGGAYSITLCGLLWAWQRI